MRERVYFWWASLVPDERARWHGVGLCGVLFLIHYALYSTWFIEDAAITFSYARNAATGEGLVPFPGGERVEGFSNPTWTLLLILLRLWGVSPWIGAKLLGALFGLGALPLAYAWAKRMMGEDAGLYPVLAPLLLAISPQHVGWCAAGLENPLFIFLLGLGAVLLLREIDSERTPWSAIPWMLLAITRPEAPLYSAAAAGLGAVFILNRRGIAALWRWGWRWSLLAGVPFLAWHAWRIAYFAWPLPNTYYAKLGADEKFQPLQWDKRGWKYLRSYALASGQGFLLPVYLFGQTGWRDRRWIAAALGSLILLFLLLPGLTWPREVWTFWPEFTEPEWVVAVRVVCLTTLALMLPGVGIDRETAAPRTLGWCLALIAIFFGLYSGGDWMDGFRWMSMGILPLSVLYADGTRTIGSAVAALSRRRRPRQVLIGLLVAVPVVMGGVRSWLLFTRPETSPYDVGRRVRHMQEAQARLHLDHVALMEVDMGAHMWWSGFELIDMAGLIDVPMGHHKWEKPFIAQYMYEEKAPEFAHVHGGWGSRTRMRSHKEWKGYVEIAPYPVSQRSQHVGNHVHKRLFVAERWEGTPGRNVRFGENIELVGWDVPAPEVAVGDHLYLEIAWNQRRVGTPFRTLVFLSGQGQLHVWEIPPGYDWYRANLWKKDEVVHGRHTLPLPADFPPGSYDLGMLTVAEGQQGGVVLPATTTPPNVATHDPRLATGEVRWRDAVTLVSEQQAIDAADTRVAEAIEAAGAGYCARAEDRWAVARRHLGPDHPWQARAKRDLTRPIARCWAARAEGDLRATEAIESLEQARAWDHRDPYVIRVASLVADEREAKGDAAMAEGDVDAAYPAWRDALRVDPSRAWVRRRAEKARDVALEREAAAEQDE